MSSISSDLAAEAILNLIDRDGHELLLSLKSAAQLLNDIDDYKGGREDYGVELGGLALWALSPAREFAEKLEAAFLAWVNADAQDASATE